MSSTQWASVAFIHAGVVPAGTQIGDDTVEGELALVIYTDPALVIEGDREDLINFFETAVTNIKEHR
jgi:hypothetical protein